MKQANEEYEMWLRIIKKINENKSSLLDIINRQIEDFEKGENK